MLAHKIDALDGIGAIAHDIAKADHFVVADRFRVGDDGLERCEVRVDVADDGNAHADQPRFKSRQPERTAASGLCDAIKFGRRGSIRPQR